MLLSEYKQVIHLLRKMAAITSTSVFADSSWVMVRFSERSRDFGSI